MSITKTASNITAPTQFLQARNERYAYRRFGMATGRPLLFLQHFMGTLDNWDPAVTDPLASGREVILFESAGVGRSSGKVPGTVAGMATHALAFLDGLEVDTCDVLGFSLGGMVAQQMAQDRPSIFRRMILVGTAPRGGEDIMHLEKPRLARYYADPKLQGYAVLPKIFFALTESSQAAGEAFIRRLAQRKEDLEPASGPEVAAAQMAAFRDWEQFTGERFANLKNIRQPTLVVNGVHDEMIPVRNSYWLSENLPNAVLLTYPDSGHGSLFQFHESFTRQATAFLASDSPFAPYELKAPAGVMSVVPHQVNRLVIEVADPFEVFRQRYEGAVPQFDRERLAELVLKRAGWDEVLAVTDAATPHGFLIYWSSDVDPLMALAGDGGRCVQYLMGNHTIAERMYRHDPAVMLYAPLRTAICTGPDDRTYFVVDQPSTVFSSFGIRQITEVGSELDRKLAGLLKALGAPVPDVLTEK